MRQIGEHNLIYNLNKLKNKSAFDILNDTSEIFILVQLMDTLGNMNHGISILDNRIFDSNYEKALNLTRESLDLICSPSVVEEQVVESETVFYYVRYMWQSGNLKTG